ncbi:radical SAM protein [Merismopedia glauca]|uniref:Radical SAM protein n=1 Tax=Merismopedia glauca CCAP 1448/3 TaxID=1296344 RepID=A0A2T1C113_9CYAN|nr:radical SAM protein [Merismopedia glauca]PSB01959.1 radical SAM protein [Merismopedia glauca CCAP 1448/3]
MAPLVANYYLTNRIYLDPESSLAEDMTAVEDANLTDVARNLSDLRRLGVKYINLAGTEPLLYADIQQVLTLAKEQGLVVSLSTSPNLYLKQARKIKGLVDYLNFSLDDDNIIFSDKSASIEAGGSLLAGIELARSLGEYPVLNFTINLQNYHYLEAIAKLSQSFGVRVWLILNSLGAIGEDSPVSHHISGMSAVIEAVTHKYSHIGYNKAALAFLQAGGNDRQNPRCQAVDAAISISTDDRLLMPCSHIAQTAIPIEGKLFDLYQSSPIIEKSRKFQGKMPPCQGCTLWTYMIPSFFIGVDKYWWLNQLTYAGEVLARRRFLQRA